MINFSKMMIILFNFMMVLGFITAVLSMKEFNLILGLSMLIAMTLLTLIFNYYEVIKHQRFN